MKLLTLVGMGVAASYCYKTMKNGKLALSKPDFDESVKRFVLQELVVFKKLCHFLKLLKTGMMHYGNYI